MATCMGSRNINLGGGSIVLSAIKSEVWCFSFYDTTPGQLSLPRPVSLVWRDVRKWPCSAAWNVLLRTHPLHTSQRYLTESSEGVGRRRRRGWGHWVDGGREGERVWSVEIHVHVYWTVVLQATPFAERGRVWVRCNYRVVTEERNYWT